MKMKFIYACILGLLMTVSCNNKTNSEEQSMESDSSMVVQQEKELASDAQSESEAAKNEAQETEKSVDELLKDI